MFGRVKLCFLACAALAMCQVAHGQTAAGQDGRPKSDQASATAPTFRSGITAVQIDALVTDAAGAPVLGLTADDFEILERGKRRDIVSFAAVDLPLPTLSPAPAPSVESDLQVNTSAPGRTYVIALDEVGPDRALRARFTGSIHRRIRRRQRSCRRGAAGPRAGKFRPGFYEQQASPPCRARSVLGRISGFRFEHVRHRGQRMG